MYHTDILRAMFMAVVSNFSTKLTSRDGVKRERVNIIFIFFGALQSADSLVLLFKCRESL